MLTAYFSAIQHLFSLPKLPYFALKSPLLAKKKSLPFCKKVVCFSKIAPDLFFRTSGSPVKMLLNPFIINICIYFLFIRTILNNVPVLN